MAAKTPILEPYKSKNGKWYWRLIAKNGKKTTIGGQGFNHRFRERDRQMLIRLIETAVIKQKKKNETKRSAKRVR